MRIEYRLITSFIAVLAAVRIPKAEASTNSTSGMRKSPRLANIMAMEDDQNREAMSMGNRGWFREMQAIVRREGGDSGGPVDCCPSVLEMVEPEGGKNQQDMYVELYRDGDNRQRFYELSCKKGVENKPCRFIDRKLYNQSLCVQKFSYTYALVRDTGSESFSHHHHQMEQPHHQSRHRRKPRHFPALPNGGWMLDYIRVRSGCACELRAKKRHKKTHSKRLPHPFHDGDNPDF